jgi:hypothetical protein
MRKTVSIALLGALFSVSNVQCGDAAAWKQRSVYQLVTDRFAKGNGDKSACNLNS